MQPLQSRYVSINVEHAQTSKIELHEDLNPQSIQNTIYKIFGKDGQIMAAIMMAESHGNPKATHVNTNGSIDRGLFQINSTHGYKAETLYNPQENIQAAKKIYEKQGLNAWSAYKNGSYKKYL